MARPGETTSAHDLPSPAAEERPPPKRSLPNGPCNYHDVAFGSCGCSQFWDKCSTELHDGSKEHKPSSERSTWCVCGHHACFHLYEARAGAADRLPAPIAAPHQRLNTTYDARCQLHRGVQCSIHKSVRMLDDETLSRNGSQPLQTGRLKASQSGPSQMLMHRASQVNAKGSRLQKRDSISQASTSSLPSIPSVCLLSHDRRTRVDAEVRQVRSAYNQTEQAAAGLGLSLINPEDRQPSVTSTVPDDIGLAQGVLHSEPEIPSTRANSIRSDREVVTSPSQLHPLDQVLEFNRTLHLDVAGDTLPNTYNPDDFIQSATEVATPSNANTPDLGVVDQALHDTKKLVESLAQLTSTSGYRNGQEERPASAMSAPAVPLLLANSPAIPHEQLQQVLKSGSPQAIQKLVSYLAPLHNLLNSIPNVANTMRELTNRVDLLENNSFNSIQPEDIQQQFELYDGRLLELEHRMDDHDRLHQAIDADHGSSSLDRRRVAAVNDSFGSNYSLQSTTSSALILAAMDRKEMETEIEGLKDRLDVIEAAAMPTLTNPWEVEVVLLPWGPELRGIWFSPDAPMHDQSKAVTQDSEEWTQGIRPSRNAPNSQGPVHAPHLDSNPAVPDSSRSHESGSIWSSEAISYWAAGSADDWLFPKACGSHNMVYKRLQSRGFVKNVTLKSANSRDIQATLSTAFSGLLDYLKFSEDDEESTADTYPGLQASFIPLRKVFKESRLRFLTPAEMTSSALWSAQFLASGIMMRVSGGRRRLYVTQREAYLQINDAGLSQTVQEHQPTRLDSWTWQQIRLLPRFQLDTDSQMEGNDEQCQPPVPEGDAKEACWAFFEPYDLPPVSVTSSFSSHHSAPVQLQMRPADRQWRRSITPSSILKNRQPQPISPLSENHPPRPAYGRSRTFSASVLEKAPQASSKRRLNASPIKSARIASASLARQKRRRVAPSSSSPPDVVPILTEQQGQVVVWNKATRRSGEPPSPFYSSNPGLARTNSDVASRSERSAGVRGMPFPYATPHSYSGPVGGRGDAGGFADNPGDTEPDDDNYEDDGEQSWRGVTDGENNSGDDSDVEGGAEAEDPGSFSGDSAFGSDEENESDHVEDDDDDFSFGAQHEVDDEDGEAILDRLLGVLEH